MCRFRAAAIATALGFGQKSIVSACRFVSSSSFISLAWTSKWSSTGTIVSLVEPENLSLFPFVMLSQLGFSRYTIGIRYQSSNDLCSLIHHWSLHYHQYLLNICGWDCVFLEVLLIIRVSIFSTRSIFIIVHISAFLPIYLNRRLQWNLLHLHLFQEPFCLVIIRLNGCSLQRKLKGHCSNWSKRQAVFLHVHCRSTEIFQ